MAEPDRIAVTHHQITLRGQVLKYTARAGWLPIRDDETGEVHACMFFVSYMADLLPAENPRPLTFAWNGGPGAPSLYVHMEGFGPRIIRGENAPVNPPAAESDMEDNQATLLDRTDLVFVDAVGTGFSRVTKPEYQAEFYSVLGDIKAFAEFIRLYRDRFGALASPLFFVGESYGTWRASGVAEALERDGITVDGVVLLSGGIQVGSVFPDELKTALYVPEFTAAAYFHRKLVPDLQSTSLQSALEKSETWAKNVYAPSLENRDKLTWQEHEVVITQLAHFTGLSPAVIDRDQFNLTITSSEFCKRLLWDQKRTCWLLDSRVTNFKALVGRNQAMTMIRYLRSVLQFNPDMAYAGLEVGYRPSTSLPQQSIGRRWKWNQAPYLPPNPSEHFIYSLEFDPSAMEHKDAIVFESGDGPPNREEPWLCRAMKLNPRMKVFVGAGIYDTLNSCSENSSVISQIDTEFGRRMKATCYSSGHIIYETRRARFRLSRDISNFIRETATGSVSNADTLSKSAGREESSQNGGSRVTCLGCADSSGKEVASKFIGGYRPYSEGAMRQTMKIDKGRIHTEKEGLR